MPDLHVITLPRNQLYDEIWKISVSGVAKKYNLKVHLDGARLFNAAVSLGCDAKDIAQYADSVTFCLSKGLCAPYGSVIVGSKEFIDKARRHRKMIGGGTR